MTTAIALQDITIYPVVEQQGPFFDALEFFPTLTKELLEENRSWLQPTFIDPVSGRLVLCGIDRNLRHIFTIFRLPQLFPICRDEQEALQTF